MSSELEDLQVELSADRSLDELPGNASKDFWWPPYKVARLVELERARLHELSQEQWTTTRPTAGKWWVAIHPSRRVDHWPTVERVDVPHSGVVRAGMAKMLDRDAWDDLTSCEFEGALYLPRIEPADPFAGRT